MMSNSFAGRRESRKRRRLSERRRVFSRLGGGTNSSGDFTGTSTEYCSSWSSSGGNNSGGISKQTTIGQYSDQYGSSSRGDSPINLASSGDQSKISMKIQFHITVAPDNEPLILDFSDHGHSPKTPPTGNAAAQSSKPTLRTTESIGEQIHERLSRQNTLSTRRRNQLMAMHNQSAMENNQAPIINAEEDHSFSRASMPENLAGSVPSNQLAPLSRESGARSSTISGGVSDEATMRFLAKHHAYDGRNQATRSSLLSQMPSQQVNNSGTRLSSAGGSLAGGQPAREHIYFKRDGQRFGHEFTLKLAVDKTYRCLLKVRPLIPLQAITIQGHQVTLVDCSHQGIGSTSKTRTSKSAPSSSSTLNNSWQEISTSNTHQSNTIAHNPTTNTNHQRSPPNINQKSQHMRLQLNRELLYQQQQSQMLRHFATSHCSSSNAHLGGQLIYMFDWSAAGRFEVNKNKNRTQVNAILKFKNGQILSLPLQIKFYQPECRQHLNWGSQLHFIDFDCNINSMGNINVDRIQYY